MNGHERAGGSVGDQHEHAPLLADGTVAAVPVRAGLRADRLVATGVQGHEHPVSTLPFVHFRGPWRITIVIPGPYRPVDHVEHRDRFAEMLQIRAGIQHHGFAETVFGGTVLEIVGVVEVVQARAPIGEHKRVMKAEVMHAQRIIVVHGSPNVMDEAADRPTACMKRPAWQGREARGPLPSGLPMAQPLTAPIMTPLLKYFCRNG